MIRRSCFQCRQGDHLFHVKQGEDEILIIGGPKPYLWAGKEQGIVSPSTLSGKKTLAKLADAIRKALRTKSKKTT